MSLFTPYTYLIGWSNLNLWYYGVRYAKNCNPNDLWKTYYTSSKLVQQTRILHGEPDVVKVRRVFSSVKTARKWETKCLRRLKVHQSKEWLNQHYNEALPIMYGPCTQQRRKSISDARKKTKKIECPYCLKLIDPGNAKQFHFEKCKVVFVDVNLSEERKRRMKLQKENGTFSPPKKPQGIFTCNHCTKSSTNYGVMQRFHFSKCPKAVVLPLLSSC